jgi:hypothetical protein
MALIALGSFVYGSAALSEFGFPAAASTERNACFCEKRGTSG